MNYQSMSQATVYINKRERKLKGNSRIANLKTQATLDTERRQLKKKDKEGEKQKKPTKTKTNKYKTQHRKQRKQKNIPINSYDMWRSLILTTHYTDDKQL